MAVSAVCFRSARARADKGKCILRLADVAAHAEGQIFIALPPDDWDWREVQSGTSRHGPNLEARKSCNLSQHAVALSSGRGERPLVVEPVSAPHPNPLPTRAEREKLESSLVRMKAALGDAPLYLAASHTYRGDDRARIAALAALGERCGTPIVATNDVLYHSADRRPLQDVMTCIREKTTLARGRSSARSQRRAAPESAGRDGAPVQGSRSGTGAHARYRRSLPFLARRTRLRIPR